jgi:hypothetical protein
MTRLLLYADDPGAANYLGHLPAALSANGYAVNFVVNPSLMTFAAERGYSCSAAPPDVRPDALLQGVDALIVGSSQNPRCLGHDLVSACRRIGLPSFAVIDLEVNADKRFRGESENPLQYIPDRLAVPDDATRAAYVRLGVDAEKIAVCGHPHYDYVRRRRSEFAAMDRAALRKSLFPEAPESRPVWLFLSEGTDGLAPSETRRSAQYSLHGRGKSDARTAIVLEELLDAAALQSPRPWVVLRPHPQNYSDVTEQYAEEIDQVIAGGDPLPLVWAADLTIGMSTMLLLEAYLLGCPTLAILPRAVEKSWLPTLAAGLTPVALTREAIGRLLDSPATLVSPSSSYDIFPSNCVERVIGWVTRSLMIQSNDKQVNVSN